MITEALLSPAEAAEFLGVAQQTLAVWRTTGRYSLPFLRVGRRIKYRRAELERWLETRVATSNGQAAD